MSTKARGATKAPTKPAGKKAAPKKTPVPKASKPKVKAASKPKADKPQAQPKNKGGRPSKYSPELIKSICERLSKGEPLAVICRSDGMPDPSTVWDWQQERTDVSQAIARAREHGEDWLAAECLVIADTPVEGVIEKMEPDNKGELKVVERRREDMLGHRKLQIETRLKLLAKWNPKKWGDKVSVDANVDVRNISDEDLNARLAAKLGAVAALGAAAAIGAAGGSGASEEPSED